MDSKLTYRIIADAKAAGGIRSVAAKADISNETLSNFMRGKTELTQEEIDRIYAVIGSKAPKLSTEQSVASVGKEKPKRVLTKQKEGIYMEEKKTEKTMQTEEKATAPVAEKPQAQTTESKAVSKFVEKKEPELVGSKNVGTVKRVLGLKKTDSLAPDEIDKTLETARALLLDKKTKEVDDELALVRAMLDEIAIKGKKAPDMSPAVNELLKAASEASDEGIKLAITILKKWKKN